MKKTEDKYFFISRLVLVFTLLGVLFVYTTNGKGMSNEIADSKVGRSSPELSVTSSSTATGMFAPN